jgi:hypothetical protein
MMHGTVVIEENVYRHYGIAFTALSSTAATKDTYIVTIAAKCSIKIVSHKPQEMLPLQPFHCYQSSVALH